jgi:hypothetical protein
MLANLAKQIVALQKIAQMHLYVQIFVQAGINTQCIEKKIRDKMFF